MDLTQLLALICGPYGPAIGVAVVLGYGWLRTRFPSLPALPGPTPAPSPIPAPQPAFPLLRKLLDGLGIKVPANLADLDPDLINAVWSEVDSLADLAREKREAEAVKLK